MVFRSPLMVNMMKTTRPIEHTYAACIYGVLRDSVAQRNCNDNIT